MKRGVLVHSCSCVLAHFCDCALVHLCINNNKLPIYHSIDTLFYSHNIVKSISIKVQNDIQYLSSFIAVL